MQRIATASLDFINLSPDRKIPVGTGMINGISADTKTFPNPPVDVTALTDLNQSLSDAIPKARTGDKTAAANLLNIEKQWDAAFRSTAKYVGTVANGNEAIIRQGGCTPTKADTSPSQVPGDCKNVQAAAEHGHGTATIGCDADASVKAYLYMASTGGATIKQDGNTIVISVGNETIYVQADTHRKALLHNLESGVKLNVSMLGLNNAGCGPLSTAQSIIPQ